MTNEEAEKHLGKIADDLAEHFDSVRVFVTHHGEGTSAAISRGCGNWYAQFGQVTEWVNQQDETARDLVRKHDESE